MEEDVIVPVAMFISVAVTFGLWFMYRYRTRTELQRTVRAALDKGQELTPELVERLGQPRRTPQSDLRRALIWIAVGLGFAAFGLLVGQDEAVRPMLAIGAFPALIGLAYLLMSRFSEKDVSS